MPLILRWRPLLWVLAALCAFAAPGARSAPRFLLGVCASIHDDPATLSLLRPLGVQSVRNDIPWKLVESVPGQYAIPRSVETMVDLAISMHIEPFLILDYGNPLYGDDKPRSPQAIAAFARYAEFVTAHFKGRVRFIELENEWETHTGGTTPGTPEQYLALARQAYPAIKRANPDAIVLSGGIADLRLATLADGWLAHFFAEGGLGYVDAVSVHPYNFNYPAPEATPESAVHMLEIIHAMGQAQQRARPLDIYVTEIGIPNYPGKGGVSAGGVASYMARFVLLAAGLDYVRGVWWYGLKDQGTEPQNKEHHFGLLQPDLQRKPGGAMYAVLASLLRGYERVAAAHDPHGTTIRLSQGRELPDREVSWASGGGEVLTHAGADADRPVPLLSLAPRWQPAASTSAP
jgi:hypothetical protein